jgi:hypothetical protein
MGIRATVVANGKQVFIYKAGSMFLGSLRTRIFDMASVCLKGGLSLSWEVSVFSRNALLELSRFGMQEFSASSSAVPS